ncbi:hypothetical protein GUJ93_ZPchr0006g41822 [Zizania palustris]|uniref:F-box domain-containing protein n=1 Tax=Zizania palustris TaxID=103762 RepID=A0A8J5T952_ZIZPA|nr:hypothetical protein GUJ93_ZPchr0006g41822 [Zizania palustris]
MEGAPASEIARLPEDLLSASISRTTPRDAYRVAVVSRAFHTAADTDAVWASFVPHDLPPFADGELPPAPLSKKELFLLLSAGPLLLSDRLMSMWLDRESGSKCYMLSARALHIVWGDTPEYWDWIALTDSRFAEGAELRDVCWLEIRGRINTEMLSPNSNYAAYMVFKIADDFYGLDRPPQEASVSLGGRESRRKVCVQSYDNEGQVPANYLPISPLMQRTTRRRNGRLVPAEENVTIPHRRADGWMELEMGEFFNEEGEGGEASFCLMETIGGNWKRGLIVQGIEIRLKKSV